MKAGQVKQAIIQAKMVPILRMKSAEPLLDIVQAVADSGCRVLELTMTIDNIVDRIPEIKKKYPDLVLGLGTVYDVDCAKDAAKAGVDFIVSPILNYDLIDPIKSFDKMVVLSGFTPTEIYNAYRAGSDLVKIFPACEMLPNFIREIRGPMPNIELFPTGGLDLISAIQFIASGAVAVGLGTSVFRKDLIASKNYAEIARILCNARHRIQNMEI